MNPNNHAPRILLSVYACSPEWGSEVGMGWHWVLELAKFCKLDVITESAFRDSIEKNMRSFASANLPQFHYISINERGRKAFWEQGNWSFYYYYREWQKDVLQYVKNSLNEAKEFDAVHQLNLVGFREPGYLWKLNSQNYFWGPICGMGSVPDSFLRTLDWKSCLKYRLKNIINGFQSIGLLRVHRAVKAARTVFAVTPAEKTILQRWYNKDAVILAEVGTALPDSSVAPRTNLNKELTLVWNGIMEGRKALNLILEALVIVRKKGIRIHLNIIGDGPCRKQWQSLAEKLHVDEYCSWFGRIPHSEALRLMNEADCFLFSSWKEATSTVINEALSSGLGVICHDTCGMSIAIDSTCGIKLPLISPENSIRGFADAIIRLHNNRELIRNLSEGALQRARKLSWENKARIMLETYRKYIS